jgi:hypothetical protein
MRGTISKSGSNFSLAGGEEPLEGRVFTAR